MDYTQLDTKRLLVIYRALRQAFYDSRYDECRCEDECFCEDVQEKMEHVKAILDTRENVPHKKTPHQKARCLKRNPRRC